MLGHFSKFPPIILTFAHMNTNETPSSMLTTPALYLLPVTLGDTTIEQVLPAYNLRVLASIHHFIVEDIRSARRFIKKCDPTADIGQLTFYELNKHTDPQLLEGYLTPLLQGESMGVISEAGCPAIADPGADVVAIAQRKGCKVVPLVGPSSILMALMGSGFNGQSFAFNGYLPIESRERTQTIRRLEARTYAEDQTQLFIETPYRNDKLMQELVQLLRPETRLCVAVNISCADEEIVTHRVREWKKKMPQLGKRPCLFLFYRG